MPEILVRGVEHYYEWVRKPASDKSKPIMVFIHGWGGSARYWRSVAQMLSDDFDCLLYDLRGFGRSQRIVEVSDRASSYDLAEYAHDLAILLHNLAIDDTTRVYIQAHSMGASIAILFLSHYPHRVEKAILVCSGVFSYDEKAFAAFYRFSRYVVKFRPKWLVNIPWLDRVFMSRFLHRSISASARREFLEDFLLADESAALGTIFTSVSKYQAEIIPQKFVELRVPTILISGEYDQIIPADLAKQAVKLNPDIQLAIIPQTGHFPMLEASSNYLQIVKDFIG